MPVPVMHIGIMSMRVCQRLVHMDVRMRLLTIPPRFMRMPVMLVMRMNMFVNH